MALALALRYGVWAAVSRGRRRPKAGGRGVGFGEGRGEVGLELEAWVLGGRKEDGTAQGRCLGWWYLSMRAGDSWAWAVVP